MVNSLVTFGLPMWLEIALDPPLGPYCKLVFLSQSRIHIYGSHSSVFSLLYSSKRFMYVLLYMRDIINYHQNTFSPNCAMLKYA